MRTAKEIAVAMLGVFDVWLVYGVMQHLIWRLT